MGKIRIKTIGTPEQEDAQKEKAKRRREAKKQKKLKKKTRAPGLKGGERIVAVGPTPEELEAMELPKPSSSVSPPGETRKRLKELKKHTSPTSPSDEIRKEPKRSKRLTRSRRYKTAAKLINKNKTYPIKKAITLLRKVSFSRFNGTVEVHLSVKDQKLSGEIPLPHGSGKKLKIIIADDKLLKQLAKGKIDCDIILAKPKIMPNLAKFGKFLGPRGLMPNPKNGTVTDDPEKKAKELQKGKVQYKTEKQAPIIHLVFGKMDFKDNQLIENFQAIINTIGSTKIKKAVIKSTMSPGIKIAL